MRSDFRLVLFMVVLLPCLLYLSLSQGKIGASVVYSVHNVDTGLNYSTIQEAIDASETLDGHTILVDSGTYFEHVIIDKSVSLLGQGASLPVVDGNGSGAVVTITANNVTVQGFTIQNGEIGLQLNSSSSGTISGNDVSRNSYANMVFHGSSHNDLAGNNVTNSVFGIVFQGSNYNSIIENNMSNFLLHAVLFADSSNNTILRNDIRSNSGKGISFNDCFNNTIIGNTVVENLQAGIYASSSKYNLITENILLNNSYAIYFSESSNNTVYHNNLVSTVADVHIYNFRTSAVNVWDDGYPSGGNYYGSYSGGDTHTGPYQNESGSDGIGDVPFIIQGDSQDNYPLAGFYYAFNAAPSYRVQVVSNSSISAFHYDSTAMTFSASGQNGTEGFCRVRIPTGLMPGQYKVFVNGLETTYTLNPFSDSAQSYLYFTYSHSTQEIRIIPELPSFLILQVLMTTALLATAIRKKTSFTKSQKQQV